MGNAKNISGKAAGGSAPAKNASRKAAGGGAPSKKVSRKAAGGSAPSKNASRKAAGGSAPSKKASRKAAGGSAPVGSNSSAGGLRRVVAIIAIVLLLGLYLVTFVLAIVGNENSAGMFRFCLGMTLFVPIFAWVMIWCIGYFRNKRNMASLDILDSNPEERERMERAIAREMRKEGGDGK